jgi:hypothetical protein
VRDSARKEVAAQICVRRADTVQLRAGGRMRGSDGSNSAPSCAESANHRFLSVGAQLLIDHLVIR